MNRIDYTSKRKRDFIGKIADLIKQIDHLYDLKEKEVKKLDSINVGEQDIDVLLAIQEFRLDFILDTLPDEDVDIKEKIRTMTESLCSECIKSEDFKTSCEKDFLTCISLVLLREHGFN